MDQDQENKGVNLNDILLPKKEGRTPASASRANAGVLLEQEQGAQLPKPAPVAPPPAPPKPEGPKDETSVQPLETYQRDMETVISQKNISTVSIAAAEAERASRSVGGITATPINPRRAMDWKWVLSLVAVVLGVALVLVATGLLAYVLLRPTPSVVVGKGGSAPFMAIDNTQILVVKPEQFNHATLMQNFESLKEKTSLSLGLVSRLYVVLSSTTIEKNSVPPPVSIQELITALAPNIPDSLARTFDPNYYLLGIHVFDGNEPFLILKVDSYEQAFSGMLEWERTMPQELSPVFIGMPRPRTQTELAGVSTTTATTVLPTQFKDKIIANHDARALINDQGDTLLLWAFIDRTTLVITTNENTLAELISRRSTFTPAQ